MYKGLWTTEYIKSSAVGLFLPTFIVEFERGDHRFALMCVGKSMEIAELFNGCDGILLHIGEIERTDPLSPDPDVPDSQLLAMDWTTRLKIYCLTPEAEKLVRSIALPSGATLIERTADNANDSDISKPN